MRQCFVRRNAMQPYIYTAARQTHDTGVGFLRPLYYDWPEAPEAYDARNEYMFGDSILADPITEPVAKDSQLAKTTIWSSLRETGSSGIPEHICKALQHWSAVSLRPNSRVREGGKHHSDATRNAFSRNVDSTADFKHLSYG